jgi:hypothetical protein
MLNDAHKAEFVIAWKLERFPQHVMADYTAQRIAQFICERMWPSAVAGRVCHTDGLL